MERKSWQKKLNVDKWKKKNEKKKFSLLSSNQCKWNTCCLVCLFSLRVFLFFPNFFYLAVVEVEGGRKPRKPRREGKDLTKGPGEGKKMLNLLFARFIIFLLFFGVNSRYLLCRRDGLWLCSLKPPFKINLAMIRLYVRMYKLNFNWANSKLLFKKKFRANNQQKLKTKWNFKLVFWWKSLWLNTLWYQ